MKTVAVVLAAGSGKRMRSNVAKQYIQVNGHPIIYYSLNVFQSSFVDDIILVVPSGDEEYCKKEIVEKYKLTKVKAIVTGGKERYNSVYNALAQISSQEYKYVFIHDGARPMIDDAILKRCLENLELYKTAVVGMPVKDTIKKVAADGMVIDTPDRNTLWQVQTPQCFDVELVKIAYDKMMQSDILINITDDAQVVENYSNACIKMVQGAYTNIKITTPEDISIAQKCLKMPF